MNKRKSQLIDLVGLGIGMAYYSGCAENIDWLKVSGEFRVSYMKVYMKAYELINSDIDKNNGITELCILNRIGYMINNNEINGRAFDKAYEDVINLALEELGIME